MTKEELAILFNVSNSFINRQFTKAESYCDGIRLKKGQASAKHKADYTFEECVAALSNLTYWNPMLSRYLREHFNDRKSNVCNDVTIKLSTGAKEYLRRKLIYGQCRPLCCNCEFLTSRRFNKPYSSEYPFCTWYNVFLNKTVKKIDIYRQRCPTHIRSNRPELIWTSIGVYPITQLEYNNGSVSIKENDKTVLGFNNSDFTSKHKKGEPIVILKDMYAED